MELALLVYSVDLLIKVSNWLWTAFAVSLAIPSLTWLYHLVDSQGVEAAKESFSKWFNIKLVVPLFAIALLIPSQQTMKYIAAGYLIQETFESEFVQETVTLSQKAVIKQLQVWSEGDNDIQELLNSVDLPLPKKTTKEENTQ